MEAEDLREKWVSEFNRISDLQDQETDRAAAVLATSFREEQLKDRLGSFLIDEPSVEDLRGLQTSTSHN